MISKIITSMEFWTISVPVASAILVWTLNEVGKRKAYNREKKQECYSEMLCSISGLLEGGHNPQKAAVFVDNLNKLWLYAPDNVVRDVNNYAQSMIDNVSEDIRKEKRQKLILSMRNDVLNRTELKDTENLQISAG